MTIFDAAKLSNDDLVQAVGRLAGTEREATVALIVHLGEFDARRLGLAAGFRSTFAYCREVLHLSEDAASNRIKAARTARQYPAVLGMLRNGTLSPTTVRMLAPHLTPENHVPLLAAAAGKGKDDVEKVLGRFFPQPDVADSVRKVPVRTAVADAVEAAVPPGAPSDPSEAIVAVAQAAIAAPDREAPLLARSAPPAAASRATLRPLSPSRYEVRFTAGEATCEKLKLAKDLLGHAVPSGDLAEIVDRALTLLIEDVRRKKFAAVQRPRGSRGQAADSRHVPADVARAVRERDGERCAYVAPSGRRCDGRRRLEFDHYPIPFAAGGPTTVENLQLRCRAHNGYSAALFFGPMREYLSEAARTEGGEPPAPSIPSIRSGTGNPAERSAVVPPPPRAVPM